MNVVTRIVPSTGAAFLVVIDACGSCFRSPGMVQNSITRGAIYQNPKTRVLHAFWIDRTNCGLDIPKEHEATVEVVT